MIEISPEDQERLKDLKDGDIDYYRTIARYGTRFGKFGSVVMKTNQALVIGLGAVYAGVELYQQDIVNTAGILGVTAVGSCILSGVKKFCENSAIYHHESNIALTGEACRRTDERYEELITSGSPLQTGAMTT